MGIKYFITNNPDTYVSQVCKHLTNQMPIIMIFTKFKIHPMQTWKSARDYCCSLGMKLVNFPTIDHLNDAYNTLKFGMMI